MRGTKLSGLSFFMCVMGLAAVPTSAQQTDDRIVARPISYTNLGKLVRSHRGKVIVVDFWSLSCEPCKREFPHLVELNRKYGKDGFVAMSVALDNPRDKVTLEGVNKFLQKKQAAFTNLIAEGDPDNWYNSLKIGGIPCVFVFDKENRRVKKLVGEEVDYRQIETEVVNLIAK